MVSFKSLYQTQVTETGVIFDGLTEETVATTASIAPLASFDIDIPLDRAYLLCCIETDLDALVRVYGSTAGRAADVRAAGDPLLGTEESLIAEVDTSTGGPRIDLSPSVVAVNSDVPQSNVAYLRVFNLTGGATAIEVTLTTSTVGSPVETAAMSRAEVLRIAAFPIPSPTPPIPIVWDIAGIDSGGMTDIGGASPERVTIVQNGRYVISATVQTDIASYAGTGATETALLIAINGTTFIAGQKDVLTTTNPILNVTAEADLFAGDYVTLDITHDGGAAGPIGTTPIAPPNDFPKLSVIQVPDNSGAVPGTKFTGLVGDGASMVIPVSHNLATRDVLVTVYRNSAPFDEILVSTEHTDADTVTLDFSPGTPLLNEFAIVVRS